MPKIQRVGNALLLPAAVLFLAAALAPWLDRLGIARSPWLDRAPWLIFGLAAALALCFYRARLALGLLACTLLLPLPWAVQDELAWWLLPLNLFLAAVLPSERAALGVLAAQFVGLSLLQVDLPTRPALGLAGLWAVVALGLLYRIWRYQAPLESGLLALLAAGGAAGLCSEEPQRLWWLSAGGLTVLLGLVQHSYRMAYLDELTELPARRALNEELGRLRGQYCIAMLDVDHFKSFNDKYGHDVGDQVLRLVASRMRRAGGPGRAFRYGGEEFTLVFPGRSLDEVWDVLEDVRRTVEATPMVLRSPDRPRKRPNTVRPSPRPLKRVTVTISIGVAERSPKLNTPEAVIKAADKALYRAKKNGRNQVAV